MSYSDAERLPSPPPGSAGTKPRSWDNLPVDPPVPSVLQYFPDRNIAGIPLEAGLYWGDMANYVRSFASADALRNSYTVDPSQFTIGHLGIVADTDSTWRLDKKSVPPVLSDWTEVNDGMSIKLWTPNRSWKRGDIALVPWVPIFYRDRDLNVFVPGHVIHVVPDTYTVWVAQDDIDEKTLADPGHAWLACNVPPGMYVREGLVSHKTVSWSRVGHSTNTYFLRTFDAGIVFAMVSSKQVFAEGDKVVVVRDDDPGGENNLNWIGKIFQFDGSPIVGAVDVGAPSTETATRFSSGWKYVQSIDTPIGDRRVPISPNANGIAGDMAFDANHLYVCVAMDTWVRFAADHTGGW